MQVLLRLSTKDFGGEGNNFSIHHSYAALVSSMCSQSVVRSHYNEPVQGNPVCKKVTVRWIEEYMQNPIAEDSDDDKKLRQVASRAMAKKSRKRKTAIIDHVDKQPVPESPERELPMTCITTRGWCPMMVGKWARHCLQQGICWVVNMLFAQEMSKA